MPKPITEEARLARNERAREDQRRRREERKRRRDEHVERYVWDQARALCLNEAYVHPRYLNGQIEYWIGGIGHRVIALLLSIMDPETRTAMIQPYVDDPRAGHPQAAWKVDERKQQAKADRDEEQSDGNAGQGDDRAV